MAIELSDPIKIILAIFLPPVGVFLEVGLGLHFWLNIVLTLFGFIPGILHALYIILAK
ncbi:YqaE/Pmp3 family membrane protein [Novipirellula sp.]|uniref:YqaE/Pmp3 family membrane protein n=1 Tax=Novipirellula sp. TaxID=2795430 RepID=UPI003561C72A